MGRAGAVLPALTERSLLLSQVTKRWHWEQVLHELRRRARVKDASPNRVLSSSIVSRSRRPKKGAKRLNGRKRHLLVDTLALVVAAVVHPASDQDRDGARDVLQRAQPQTQQLQHLWADVGYAGDLLGDHQ